MLYIIPNSGDASLISDLARKAGIPVESPTTIRDLITFDRDNDNLIALISSEQALILSRHLPQLLEDTPYVVQAAPGIIYTGEWQIPTTAFPSMDYMELEQKLRKSGHTAFDKGDMAARSGQSKYLENPGTEGDEERDYSTEV